MVTQRQLNYSKRSLKEKSEETKKFIQAKAESALDIDLAKGHKKRLVELLQEFTNQIEEFDAANPEDEESNTLFETYLIVKNDAQNMLALLESKIEGKENEIERLEREKEASKEEKRRYKEMEMDLAKEKLRMEHEAKIRMEEIEIEKLRIRAENKIETVDTNAKFGNVKLPKLELPKFDGDIMKFQAFWDAFDSTINKNTRLNPIDKFTYLKSQLTNQAREIISGLDITDANYKVAIDLLHERYGKRHLLIQAHYARLKEIPTASPYYDKLRQTTDEIEKHIRSLESLGETIESNLMVSLIVSKLPLSVIIKLKEYKSDNQPWTVKHLREELTKYMDIQEEGEKLTQLNKNNNHNHRRDNDQSLRRNYHNHYRMSTGSLAAGERTSRQPTCIYCGGKHWSDECKQFSDLQSRKNKIVGCCYNCLKKGHQIKDCEIKRQCVYCKKIGHHHRSLCQKQFGNVEETTTMVNQEESAEAVLSGACIDKEENALVAVGESVIMQTALVEVTNSQDNIATSSKARLIMDSGSQRSYISEELAKELNLKKVSKNFLSIHTFGSTKPKEIETHVAKLGIVLKSGFTMNIHVNIVPQVTGFIERKPINSKDIYEKIKLYDLADVLPTKLEQSKLEILIGNYYYNDIVSMKKINVSNGLYLLQSKLGWILSGRIKTNQINDSEQSLLMLTNSSSPVSS